MFQRLAIRTHWEKATIRYNGKDVDVSYMPETNDNIAVDGDGRFYVHNNTRGWARVHGSIFDLERMLWNIVYKGRSEVIMLEKIEAIAQELHADLVTTPFGTVEDETVVSNRFAILADPLQHACDEVKKEAHGQFCCCVLVRDTQGRLNRGMLRTRTLAALKRLIRRIAEIRDIQPHIMVWLGEVQLVARDTTFLLNSIGEDLATCITMLEDPRMSLPTTGAIERILRDVAQLNVRPFLTFKIYLGKEGNAALAAIIHKDRARALTVVRRSYNSVQLKRERIRLQWLLLNFSMLRNDKKPTEGLMLWLWNAHSRLAKIDETGFKKPVVYVVRAQLACVAETWKREDLKKTHDLLVKAVSML